MKIIKKTLLACALTFGGLSFAMAQGQSIDPANLNIPDGYYQEQGESPGVASYSIDEPTETGNENSGSQNENGAASWRQYSTSGTEELQIYSGNQDGNNLVKIIEVKVPESSYDSPY